MLTLRPAHAARSFLAVALFAATALASAAERLPRAGDDAIDQLVAQVCDKQVVMLGEDAQHGSGATLQAKAEVVRRLVERCGFDAVHFESQLYDFLDFEAAVRAGRATPALLADAIGGFWATTADMQTLIAFLFDRASRSGLDVQGLDPQLGGATQRYAQDRLPGELVSSLGENEREACRADMARFTGWVFDAATPFDDAFRRRVTHCAARVRESASPRDPAAGADVVVRLAENFRMAVALAGKADLDMREQAMFDNLVWLASRRVPAPRIIVWCATAHALRQGRGGSAFSPLGERLAARFGDRIAAIGFSAAAGSIAPPRSAPTPIEPAPAASLEGRAFAGASAPAGDAVFVGRPTLAALGPISSRVVSVARWRTEDWSALLDGILVLREERPPRYLRPPAPMQDAAGWRSARPSPRPPPR